ncbi:MAG: hypothetical protein DRQ88_07100 [Epsilonproteobacteria bacterium]|nr:MAG: hypothetical protein DRQ88_07100 [Campylobacterota bacterium]
MKFLLLLFFVTSASAQMIGNVPLNEIKMSKEKRTLVKKLLSARALNLKGIYEDLNLEGRKGMDKQRNFTTANPYLPRFKENYGYPYTNLKYSIPENPQNYSIDKRRKIIRYFGQEPVVDFLTKKNKGVCGVRFVDNKQEKYLLKSFDSESEAQDAGYMITHRSHCGTCSSLKDLAVYLAKPDLTTPAKSCSRGLNLNKVKKCYKKIIGFSNNCAEMWAYSSEQTRRHCGKTCIKFYGLLNLLRDSMDRSNLDEEGNLNVCIACDEYKSGPGFKYGVGRNRRNSGITSAIQREESDLYVIDHYKYFR